MDTREKIVPLAELPSRMGPGKWLAVVGLFDPLTAVQASRLAELADGRRLLAIVLDEPGTLLPADARAALIAALREVSVVSIAAPGEWESKLPGTPTVTVSYDPEAERARTAEFIEFVLNRQASAAIVGRKS